MKHILLSVSCLFILCNHCSAQTIQFHDSYNSTLLDATATHMHYNTADSEVVLIGYHGGQQLGSKTLLFIGIDTLGNKLWELTNNTAGIQIPNCSHSLGDGFMVGAFFNGVNDYATVSRFSNSGREMWTKGYGNLHEVVDISAVSSNEFRLFLSSFGSFFGDDHLVVTINSNGDSLGAITIALHNDDAINSGVLDYDDNYIVAGYSTGAVVDTGGMIVKLNSSGGIDWSYIFQRPEMRSSFSKVIQSSQGFLACGTMTSKIQTGHDYEQGIVVALDQNGQMLWEQTFPSSIYTRFVDIKELPSGNIYVSGDLDSTSTGSYSYKGILLKLDNQGNLLVSSVQQGHSSGVFRSMLIAANSLFVCGNGREKTERNFHASRYKDFEEDLSGTSTSVYPVEQSNTMVSFYPNPTDAQVQIKWESVSDQVNVSVWSSTGQLMHSEKPRFQNCSINVKSWTSGIYLLEIMVEDKVYREKVIIQ